MTDTLSEPARRLLNAPYFATVASPEADGSTQLSLIWVKTDGEDVVFSTLKGRRKAQNWERDTHASVLAFDPESVGQYVEVRGRVTIEDDPTGALIHELSRAYDGKDYDGDVEGRVIVRVHPDRVRVH